MNNLCQCGCGQPTQIAMRNRRDRGWIKGQPVPFIHGHNPTIPLPQRLMHFWNQCNCLPVYGRPDCIEWTGTITTNGYGQSIKILGETGAHRIAYTLTFGEVPAGLELDHLCRNRRCVNPYHLEPVTRTINTHRGARARLTMALASEIRTSMESERTIARRLGVHRSTIHSVRIGRTWINGAT